MDVRIYRLARSGEVYAADEMNYVLTSDAERKGDLRVVGLTQAEVGFWSRRKCMVADPSAKLYAQFDPVAVCSAASLERVQAWGKRSPIPSRDHDSIDAVRILPLADYLLHMADYRQEKQTYEEQAAAVQRRKLELWHMRKEKLESLLGTETHPNL